MNKQNRNRIIDTENDLMVARWEGNKGYEQKSEGIKKYKLVVTEKSWGHKIQHRKYISQRIYMQDPWTGRENGVGMT